MAWCKAEGYLDDALFARLYIEGRRKAVADARLIGELVRKGVDRDVAAGAIARAEHTQDERLALALERLFGREPPPSYGSAARSLERLGFPAAAIYRHLRAHASRFAISPIQGEDSPERGE